MSDFAIGYLVGWAVSITISTVTIIVTRWQGENK